MRKGGFIMSATIKEILQAVESLNIPKTHKIKTNISDELLGKYKGVLPKGKTSTELIKNLRSSLYGKIK